MLMLGFVCLSSAALEKGQVSIKVQMCFYAVDFQNTFREGASIWIADCRAVTGMYECLPAVVFSSPALSRVCVCSFVPNYS